MPPAESQAFATPAFGTAGLDFERAFSDFVRSMQELLNATAAHDRVNSAYLEYAGLVQAALTGQDVQARCAEAYARYLHALQEALAPAPQRERVLEAFERYARTVREAWIAADPVELTPETMATVAHRVLTAATTVAGIAHAAAGVDAARSFAPSTPY